MKGFRLVLYKDEVWGKVLTLGIVLFFVFLSDAILSFWTPNFIQDSLGSPALMGVVMGFSSLVGLLADIVFPQIFRNVTVRRLTLLGIAANLLFITFLVQSTWMPYLVIFFLAMAAWGIYYELLGFAQQQFVSDSTPLRLHSSVWGVIHVFKSLAYFFGPLLAGLFVTGGVRQPLVIASLFSGISLLILYVANRKHDRPMDFELKEVNITREVGHWKALFVHVWPIVIMSLLMGLVDATFWTTGTVWTEKLAQGSFLGNFFLPFYTLPTLFVGFVVAKWQITEGKKKKAQTIFLFSALILSLLGLSTNIYWQLGVVFLSSTLFAVALPLVDAVYSDVVARMGRERRHMMGLSNSSISVAYIIGPALAGFVSQLVGEQMTFTFIGGLAASVSFILLLTTPRKLKLPQEEIHTWE